MAHRKLLACLVFAAALLISAGAAVCAKPVGVVDQRLLGTTPQFWISPWAGDWTAEKSVEAFRKNGLDAEVIGADVLANAKRLSNYQAIFLPTDHNYPDIGSKNGPISKAISIYVRSGGTYIMPMGASHHYWKNAETGEAAITGDYPTDFLGLTWQVTGDHNTPGPDLVLTAAGEAAGVPGPPFTKPIPTYVRALAGPADIVYVSNKADQPCLYGVIYGGGILIHYAGGPPYDAAFRDWIIAAYSAILKNGGSLADLRTQRVRSGRYYGSTLVAARSEHAKDPGSQLSLSDGWELARAADDLQGGVYDVANLEWTPVRMPNSIQHALHEAGKIPNPWYGQNYKDLQWIQETDWYLRTRFTIPGEWAGRRIRLRFDGLDYTGAVWLDGFHLGTHEGMAGGPTFDITNMAAPGPHEIVVRLFHEKPADMIFNCTSHPRPAEIKADAIDGKSYVWGNRYRTIGIWQPVRIVATGSAYMEALCVRTDSLGANSARLFAQAYIVNKGELFGGIVGARIVEIPSGKVVWQEQLKQNVPGGETVWEREITLRNPRLWWPNGLGEQPLYRLELALLKDGKVTDSVLTQFGVRTLELRRNPNNPDHPRTANSVQLGEYADESYRFLWVVNGRPFYAKGASWMTSDDLLCLTPEREEWLMRAAKDNGLNFLRLNGGTSLFETDQFYDLCDKYGMVVWQELPLNWATATAAPTESWREQLKQTALRLRQHPSLGVWVGGNEFNPYGGEIVPLLGMAREILTSYTDRPFRMSSPGGGTTHAYIMWHVYAGDMNWYHKVWDRGTNFISEWSYASFANYSLLKRIVPPAELDAKPVGSDVVKFMESHPVMHDRYTQPDDVGRYVWACSSWYDDYSKADIPAMIETSQMSKAHAYGYIFEQWRAQFPYTGGESVWTFNSMGPMSSWNYIDWFGQPEIAYYSTKRANEPVHVMADTGFFSWGPGDVFGPRIFAINDSTRLLRDARVTARIYSRAMEPVLAKQWSITVPANGYKSDDLVLEYQIPQNEPEGYFFLELTLHDAAGKQVSRQAYWLRVLKALADPEARKQWQAQAVTEPLCTNGPWLKPQVELTHTTLKTESVKIVSDGREARVSLKVTNTGNCAAYPVRLSLNTDVYPVLWSDNYFWLAPGESRNITGLVRLDLKGIDQVLNPPVARAADLRVQVSAWNSR